MVDDLTTKRCRSCVMVQAQQGDNFGYCTMLNCKVYLGSLMCQKGYTEDDIF